MKGMMIVAAMVMAASIGHAAENTALSQLGGNIPNIEMPKASVSVVSDINKSGIPQEPKATLHEAISSEGELTLIELDFFDNIANCQRVSNGNWKLDENIANSLKSINNYAVYDQNGRAIDIRWAGVSCHPHNGNTSTSVVIYAENKSGFDRLLRHVVVFKGFPISAYIGMDVNVGLPHSGVVNGTYGINDGNIQGKLKINKTPDYLEFSVATISQNSAVSSLVGQAKWNTDEDAYFDNGQGCTMFISFERKGYAEITGADEYCNVYMQKGGGLNGIYKLN